MALDGSPSDVNQSRVVASHLRQIAALGRTASPVAGAAISTTVIGGLWWLAALHLCAPPQVGRYVAVYGIAVLLAELCSLGVGQTMVRYLTDAGQLWAAMARTGLALVTVLFVGSVALVAAAAQLFGRQTLLPVGAPGWLVLLTMGVAAMWFTKTEDLLLATGHRPAQLVRATLAATLRVAFLLAFWRHGSLTWISLALSYALPSILASFAACIVMRRELLYRSRRQILLKPSQIGRFAPYAWRSYLGNILAALVPNALPVLVVWQLGTTAGARFGAAWFIVNAMMLVPTAISLTTFSIVARGERCIDHITAQGAWLVLATQIPMSIAALGVAEVALPHVRAAYATLGISQLGPLLLGSICMGLTVQIYARARLVNGGQRIIIAGQLLQSGLVLSLAPILGERLGLSGFCAGWFLGAAATLAFLHTAGLPQLSRTRCTSMQAEVGR